LWAADAKEELVAKLKKLQDECEEERRRLIENVNRKHGESNRL